MEIDARSRMGNAEPKVRVAKWVDWYNNRRCLGPIGYIPPARAEEAFYANLNTLDMAASSLNKSPSGKTGAVHP